MKASSFHFPRPSVRAVSPDVPIAMGFIQSIVGAISTLLMGIPLGDVHWAVPVGGTAVAIVAWPALLWLRRCRISVSAERVAVHRFLSLRPKHIPLSSVHNLRRRDVSSSHCIPSIQIEVCILHQRTINLGVFDQVAEAVRTSDDLLAAIASRQSIAAESPRAFMLCDLTPSVPPPRPPSLPSVETTDFPDDPAIQATRKHLLIQTGATAFVVVWFLAIMTIWPMFRDLRWASIWILATPLLLMLFKLAQLVSVLRDSQRDCLLSRESERIIIERRSHGRLASRVEVPCDEISVVATECLRFHASDEAAIRRVIVQLHDGTNVIVCEGKSRACRQRCREFLSEQAARLVGAGGGTG